MAKISGRTTCECLQPLSEPQMPYQFATDATHGVMVELGSGLPQQTSPQHLAHPKHASTSICAFYYLCFLIIKLVSVDFLILRPVAAKRDFGKNMKELWQVLVLTNVCRCLGVVVILAALVCDIDWSGSCQTLPHEDETW